MKDKWLLTPYHDGLNGAGWVIFRPKNDPALLQAQKWGRVSHSLRLEANETLESGLMRLWLHVLEAYPEEAYV